MISVIIPTLWRAYELSVSISSALSRSSVCEVIVIDNDPVRAPRLEQFDSRVSILSQPENLGVAQSWNLAVTQARGDIVCLLNDDVVVDPLVYDWVARDQLFTTSVLGMASQCFNYHGAIQINTVTLRPYNYGQCMFLRRQQYIHIPLLHSFFTDDFLFDHVSIIMRQPNREFLASVRGRQSVTSRHFQRQFIQDRQAYDHITGLYPRYAYR